MHSGPSALLAITAHHHGRESQEESFSQVGGVMNESCINWCEIM